MKKIAFLLLFFTSHALFAEEEAVPSHYNDLKGLEFLVGQWQDTSDEVDVSLNYSWDPYKNFITNEFSVEEKDEPPFRAKQVIGYDAKEKRIRSWMFDSDGGFGEGRWKNQGDEWVVEAIQTFPNGETGSSINTYKKIDENSYTFESHDRVIDGEMQKDIGPITLVRKKETK